MRKARRLPKVCPRCDDRQTVPGRGYCLPCHAAYTREWRKTHPPSPDARRKDIARSYVAVYLRRGKIERQPCARCGSTEKLEAHHHRGYDRPLDVVWLCRRHHLSEHRG